MAAVGGRADDAKVVPTKAMLASIRNKRSVRMEQADAKPDGSKQARELDRLLTEPVDRALFRMEAMHEMMQETIASRHFSLDMEASGNPGGHEAAFDQVWHAQRAHRPCHVHASSQRKAQGLTAKQRASG